MTEWIDVPVAEVAVGDEVKVDGIGFTSKSGEAMAVEYSGMTWNPVHETLTDRICVNQASEWFRRSSIVAARRRKPEPSPRPGDWRCVDVTGLTTVPFAHHEKDFPHRPGCQVYRASSGWSKDTRTGQPWVPKKGEVVEVRLKRAVRSVGNVVGFGEDLFCKYAALSEVHMVDRRGKR